MTAAKIANATITSAKIAEAAIATARNGWNAIVINGQVGWVSGKYSKVV